MAGEKNGGHAFPNITPDMNVDGGPGMSLRDWFAGQALAGLMASDGDETYPKNPADDFDEWRRGVHEKWARCCYSLADAMLKARKP